MIEDKNEPKFLLKILKIKSPKKTSFNCSLNKFFFEEHMNYLEGIQSIREKSFTLQVFTIISH